MEEKEVRERDGDIVSLNVGGTGFATSRGTLIKVRGAPHSDRSPYHTARLFFPQEIFALCSWHASLTGTFLNVGENVQPQL